MLYNCPGDRPIFVLSLIKTKQPMKNIKLYLLPILIILSFSLSCSEEIENDLYDDMVMFDRALIPVLYYIHNGEVSSAKEATFFLAHNWQSLKRKYESLYNNHSNWIYNVDQLDILLSRTYLAIDQCDLNSAYEYLDLVRSHMNDIRKINNIRYYFDDIWEFESQLASVLEVAEDEMLCLLEYCEFESLTSDMFYAWESLKYAQLEQEVLGLDYTRAAVYRYHKQALDEVLHEFSLVIDEADGKMISMSVPYLRIAYLDYLYCFGDFIGSENYYSSLNLNELVLLIDL